MRKETADLLEMLGIPMTREIKDLLDQMDKWVLPYMPEIPSMLGTHEQALLAEFTVSSGSLTGRQS